MRIFFRGAEFRQPRLRFFDSRDGAGDGSVPAAHPAVGMFDISPIVVLLVIGLSQAVVGTLIR